MSSLFLDLWERCRNGDREACERLHIYYYLLPRLEKELKEILAVKNVVIFPILQPDTLPIIPLDSVVAERKISRIVLGDPSPQPSLVSNVDRLQSTMALRDSLMKNFKFLEAVIQRLKPPFATKLSS